MEAMLVDDTRSKTVGTYGPSLAQEVSEISKYQINRHNAYGWARNLRFLVYDEDDDDETEKEQNREVQTDGGKHDENEVDDEQKQMQEAIALSLAAQTEEKSGSGIGNGKQKSVEDESITPEPEFENEQEMLDYALALSLQESEEPSDEKIHTSQVEKEKKRNLDKCGHPKSCDTCERYPRFPAFKRPTKFRVLQFRPEDIADVRICHHYAAISYCWRSDQTGASAPAEKSYRIRVQNQDGTFVERTNRAPNEIIDRAVDAARAAGFRLIWIDQECLPQDGGKEHELGIQAMDMVYQRAHITIGLFESTIQKQAHLEAVAAVLLWGVRMQRDRNTQLAQRRPGVPLQEFCLNLIEFLELFAGDMWNTRAWILQEAFSSAEDLVLFINTASNVGFHHPPEDVFDSSNPTWVEGAFSITVRDVLKLIRISKEFLMSGVVKREEPTEAQMNSLVVQGNDAHTADWYYRAEEVLKRLDRLFPIPAATTNRHAFMYAVGGSNFGPRKTCNAAVALYFLRTRLNHRPADRLAILANLCDYEIRLDTNEIETRFKSLSVCLVTLAIINGDLSLLVPGVYKNWRIQAPIEGPTWALPFQEILYSVNVKTLRAGYNLTLRHSNRYSVSDSGLTLPAALWNVNRMVDLTPIKLQWESEWKRFTCVAIEFEWRKSETIEEHEARREEILQQVQESYTSFDPNKRGQHTETYEWDFEPDPALGAKINRVINESYANAIRPIQTLLSRIFADTLRYLYNIGERSLANSIWHSIRMDCASENPNSRFTWGDSNLNALPDDVEELLMSRELISNLWLALQLDPDDRGNLSQMWLIHRIMKNGFLWAGQYMEGPSLEPSKEDLDHIHASGTSYSRPPKSRPHILQSQTDKLFMAFELKKHIHEVEQDDSQPAGNGMTLGGSVAVMYLASLEEYSWEREARFRTQVAAFDVDGPCLIATPYDSDMERLPRPVVRSMAAAWVVEPVKEPKSKVNGTQTLSERSSREVVESEEVTVDKSDLSFEDVDGEVSSSQAPSGKAKGKMKETISEADSGTSTRPEVDRFSVVDRVMGAWEIMEEPNHRYTFV